MLKPLARLLAYLSLGAGLLQWVEVNSKVRTALVVPKSLVGGLMAWMAAAGALAALIGARRRDPHSLLLGGLGALLAARYIADVTAPHDGFERAFGPGWQQRLSPEQQARLLPQRWTWRLPAAPEACWQRDVVFWTIPGTERQLLCDLWQPPAQVKPSGLAFIYLHGSGWHYLDKDSGTRPFFRHLTAQGHVVMDVAYRLCPETDFVGMVGDVKRAITWMKKHGPEYGVNPERIVVAGGSAGGHLSLLAAYTPHHPELDPPDVAGADTSVRAVVSYYGPPDLRAAYTYFDERFGRFDPSSPQFAPMLWLMDKLGLSITSPDGTPLYGMIEMLSGLLGGDPKTVPDRYDLASPITHAGPDSPPTLLLQGEHDVAVKPEPVRQLYRKLCAANVPAIYVEFPRTEHGFDLFFPQYAPATQAALYDVERFLALMA